MFTGKFNEEENSHALDILTRISEIVNKGIANRHLQRLPHLILLNTEYYRASMMPILAEWCYVWLQKQHLHGIEQSEAIKYMIEGAAARSESTTKLKLIDLALKKIEVSLGQSPSTPRLTSGYQRSMSHEEREEKMFAISELQRTTLETVQADPVTFELLQKQSLHLELARTSAEEHCILINEIYALNSQIEEDRAMDSKRIAEVQSRVLTLNKKIQEIECPRDKSLDNSVVVWCSPVGVNLIKHFITFLLYETH